MRRVAVPVAVILLSCCGQARVCAVPTWCFTHPAADSMVYCEDFDRYCLSPPPEPERCEPQGVDIRDPWSMEDEWDGNHNCGWSPGLHDEFYSSYPYCAKIGSQPWNSELGYGNTGLTDHVRQRFGSAYSAVLATDMTPLTVEFAMNGRLATRMNSANLYLELGYGRATSLTPAGKDSLTNWIISEDCSVYGYSGEQHFYPVICRQSPRPAGCADASEIPVLPVIAAGFVSFLDQNPCHPEANDHWPRTEHLAFFDGRVWHTLRKGSFPDPGGSGPAPGDFLIVPGDMQHRVRLTLKRTTVIVELRVGSPVVLSRCEIPRAYTGPFSSILMGYQTPCQLQPGTWDCNGAVDCNGVCGPAQACCVSGAAGGGTVAVDDIAMYGGQGYAEPGACCLPATPDYTCAQMYQGDCSLMGGDFKGSNTLCDNPTLACCPPLAVDHDVDGDVDMADFGWFQACLSGEQIRPATFGCKCADLDHQADVDHSDFLIFQQCLAGPDVPVSSNCLD